MKLKSYEKKKWGGEEEAGGDEQFEGTRQKRAKRKHDWYGQPVQQLRMQNDN